MTPEPTTLQRGVCAISRKQVRESKISNPVIGRAFDFQKSRAWALLIGAFFLVIVLVVLRTIAEDYLDVHLPSSAWNALAWGFGVPVYGGLVANRLTANSGHRDSSVDSPGC